MVGALPFSLILVLSVSVMPTSWGHPAPSPEVSGPPHSALLPPGCCGAGAGPARGRGLGFLTPLLEEALAKRSFRNGVGTGTKKNPFPRAEA
ncbi:unnamed protein product [Pipistrellus nathusii]|uniref:Uncharacterized protein n=1 Tax=Pipistrellus nathusii TaxID=59473 RepID=A0ABN9ZIF3_PIPNA